MFRQDGHTDVERVLAHRAARDKWQGLRVRDPSLANSSKIVPSTDKPWVFETRFGGHSEVRPDLQQPANEVLDCEKRMMNDS